MLVMVRFFFLYVVVAHEQGVIINSPFRHDPWTDRNTTARSPAHSQVATTSPPPPRAPVTGGNRRHSSIQCLHA